MTGTRFSFRKALRALSALWFGSLAGAALAFLVQVLLARELAPAGYGAFAAVLATVTLAAPLAGFGIRGLWLRVFGAEGWQARRWLKPSLGFLLLTTLATCLLVAAWAALGPHDALTRRLFWLLLPMIAAQALLETVSGKLQLEGRYGALALWQFAPHATRLLLVLLLMGGLAGGLAALPAAGAYALVSVLVVVMGTRQLLRLASGSFQLPGHAPSLPDAPSPSPALGRVAAEAWPFGVAGVLYLVYFQSDVILLKYLRGDEAAGIYNVAFVLLAAVYLLPSTVFQKFLLPKLHRWASQDPARFLAAFRLGNGLMLVGGLAAGLLLLVLAPGLVALLFGPAYDEASGLLMLLAAAVPLRFLATSVGASLVTGDNMRLKVRYMALVALLNVVLNLLLIPAWGAQGAAVATVASELVLLLLYLLAARWHVFGSEAWRGWILALRPPAGERHA